MEVTKQEFLKAYIQRLKSETAKPIEDTTSWDRYHALGSLVKEYMIDQWLKTLSDNKKIHKKQVFYFSMEFLTGRFLINNLRALGMCQVVKDAFDEIEFDLEEISEIEKDQGLGNGGLGRLAACFLDSMASLGMAGHGVGIRYNYGLFEQKIVNGYQVEYPDRWLENRNVWEVKKADKSVVVKFGGEIRQDVINGRQVFIHEHFEPVVAVPYDTPIIGYLNGKVNTLRLWSAETTKREFDFSTFSRGEYLQAFEQKHSVEAISQVLYPNDSYEEGRLLRLKQEYFFVSAGLQGIVRSFKKQGLPMTNLSDYIAVHINDTHPAVAIPELMRILIDQEEVPWDVAWGITNRTISYTNHTIMQEAMEKWTVDLYKKLLPRIYMITEEINRRFCVDLESSKFRYSPDHVAKMSIIGDGYVKMANLAIVGSHSVNGVAKLHTEILKNKELKPFYDYYPEKFNNKTNGITHRRWLLNSNPRLTSLIKEAIGDKFVFDPSELEKLNAFQNDSSFKRKLADVKFANKERFAKYIYEKQNMQIDPHSIFDVQVKRLHEYKRQTLNILQIMHMYNELLENPDLDIPPRTFIFGAKAAPGYYIAKQIIKLINSVAELVNNDPRIRDKIKVVFVENYGVSIAEILMPAAEVSEQISTTTKEASGTGNMKFMMNGAITIATLDGANVEILDEVGIDNIVIFGLKEQEVYQLYESGAYRSIELYRDVPEIKRVIDQLTNGFLRASESEFSIIRDSLIQHNDEYFVLKDFMSYVAAQGRVGHYYQDFELWNKMSVVNIAQSGVFSSDRTIAEYAKDIWNVPILKR